MLEGRAHTDIHLYLESGETELEDGTVENTKYVATEASNYIVLIDDAL